MTKVIKKTIVTILLLCTALAFACFAACGKNTPEDPSNENRQEQQANGENGQNDQNQTFPDNDNVPDIILSADGKSVIGLKNHNLTNLVISPSYNGIKVTSIGDSAFYDCDSLISVTIPDTVIIIDEYAFYDCDSLTSVTIGNSVTSIGAHAFYVCSSLNKVNYTGTIDQWVQIDFYESYSNPIYYAKNFYINNELVTEANITKATKINSYAFSGYDSLTSVTIGNNVTSIGYYAFEYCYKLVEVINKSNQHNGYLESYALNVKTEGDSEIVNKDGYLFYTYDNVNYLFGYVGNETSLTLPENYNGQNYEIHNYAFYKCDSLTSITIPDSITSIGDHVFYDCDSLTSVAIPDSVTSIGSYAFGYCNSLASVTIGSGVTSIGEYAFGWCSSLKSITIPDSVTSIGKRAFNECSSLVSITIGNGVTSIGNSAFSGCSLLTSITIPDSVASIGSYAFYNCTALTEINYNATKCADLSYNNYVFYKAGQDGTGIKVTIGKNVKNIPAYLFYTRFNNFYGSYYSYSPKITEVVFEKDSKCESIGDSAFFYCDSIESIYYNGDINDWVQIEGIYYLMYYCKSTKNLYVNGGLLKEANITTATKINDYAFYNCSSLTNVTIVNSVTYIGGSAFNGCSSLKYNEYDNAYYLGNETNKYLCLIKAKSKDITSCVINENCKFIYDSAFYYCRSLTSIIIPDNVTSIGYKAFGECSSLENVTIGKAVTSIGDSAFQSCTSLTSATFENKSGWYVSKDSTATSGTNLTLNNTSQNATYLTSTYKYYYWKRK